MGRRSEKRIAMKESILVRGKDDRGIPFVLTAQTSDIAASGAAITSSSPLGEPGAKVEIEYQGRKAWFRIQWVDKRGVSTRGRAGLKSLEPGNYIWGVQLDEWSPDSFQKAEDAPKSEYVSSVANATAAMPEPGTERRRFPRFSCRIETLVAEEGGSIRLAGKVSDISLGGCYVEMLSPMPVQAFVELMLNPNTLTLRLHGKVLTSEIGMGMGISFTTISPEDFERLREMVSPSPPQPWDPEIPAKVTESSAAIRAIREGGAKRTSHGAPATHETLAAVLRILLRKGIVSEDELAAEFEKLMTVEN
jgi:PilZ domain